LPLSCLFLASLLPLSRLFLAFLLPPYCLFLTFHCSLCSPCSRSALVALTAFTALTVFPKVLQSVSERESKLRQTKGEEDGKTPY
jgi:hypothetical protein